MPKLNVILFGFVIICCIELSVAQQHLRNLAKAHQKYIGTGVLPNYLREAQYAALADREFDCFTPGNAMKWDATEPTQGHFNFADADLIVNHGHAHGQKIRGHTLVWHSQLAHWVENGHYNATALRSIMEHHIKSVAGHFKSKLYAWDVVNEILNEDGSLRNSVFFKTLGKGYVADAFKWAHEADPSAKLYINDYNVEGINRKSTGMYNLVKELRSQGVPIHGVGIQSHFGLGHIPKDLQHNIERFAALGVDVALTEVDVAIQMPATAAKLAQQATDYASIVHACMAVPRCVGITIWGLFDKESWIPHVSPGHGSPLLFDDNYKEKPAYHAVVKALGGH